MRLLIKKLFCLGVILCSFHSVAIDVDKNASITFTNTTIVGINHIGLSVKNLDVVLAFYLSATEFELIKRETITHSAVLDELHQSQGLTMEVATLRAPNMLFELVEYNVNKNTPIETSPVMGPGMTHTCFQSPSARSGFDRFMHSGANVLTTGNAPVDIGGYGVTYAYAHDPEGNMFEMEQLDSEILLRAGYDNAWQNLGHDMWMSQVAIATHDIERLMTFYQQVLGIQPFRVGEYEGNEKLDQITNTHGLKLKGGWFKLNDKSKVMELWQFVNPETPKPVDKRAATDLGYSYSLEVGNIHQEHARLTKLGVDTLSVPVVLGEFWQFFARDIDGNVFSLRQPINPQSQYALAQIEDDTRLEAK